MHFSRPLIPAISAYITGLWLVHGMFHFSPALAVTMAALLAVIFIALSLWCKDLTPVYLLLIMVFGGVVMAGRERDMHAANALIASLEGPGVKVISGKVKATAELADTEKSRVVLSNVTVTSGSAIYNFPGQVQMTIDNETLAGGGAPLVAGEQITFPGHLQTPAALQNFYGYDRASALRHDAIYASATPLKLKGIIRRTTDRAGLGPQISRELTHFRSTVSRNLKRDMWPDEAGLMNAMLFNDMRTMTERDRQVFRDSGTFHLFAVSGMHVAILGMALHLLCRAMRMGIRTSWVTVAIILFFYLWLIGFVPSATRSYLMLVAFTAAYMLGREVDSLSALVFAYAVVVIYDPAAPWQAGFNLSVAGVAAVVLFTPLWRMWVTPPRSQRRTGLVGGAFEWLLDIALSTCAVAIVLLPLQLYYFGFWNALSPLANLLQAMLSTLVLSAGVLTAATGLINESAAGWAGHSASMLMRLIYLISEWTATAEPLIFYVRQIPVWLMLISYGILASGYYLVKRLTPEFRNKSRARFATHSFCAIGLLVFYQFIPSATTRQLEIWSFDVGQGDSTLIRFPNGQSMLVDGGIASPDMGRLVVAQQLRAMGIRNLDFMVATHDDIDHNGGLASVMTSVGAEKLLLPAGVEWKSQAAQTLLAAARNRSCTIIDVYDGYKAQAGGCEVEILNPLSTPIPNQPDNDSSIVLKITYRGFSALLTGDAGISVEERLLNDNRIGRIDVLKVGHHGSATATGESFVKNLRPLVAMISCGADNRFGHPNKNVVQRLVRNGSQILRTDRNGAICISSDGHKFSTKTRTP